MQAPGPAPRPRSSPRCAVPGHSGLREAEMIAGFPDALAVRLPPRSDLRRIRSHRTPKARLPPVRPPSGPQGLPRLLPAIVAALLDPLALHVRNLGKDSDHNLPCAPPDNPQPPNVQHDALVEKEAHRRLNVQRIAPQAVESIEADRIPVPDVGQQRSEARTILRQYRAADAFVRELLVEGPPKGMALRFNALVGSAAPEVGNTAHGKLHVSKGMP